MPFAICKSFNRFSQLQTFLLQTISDFEVIKKNGRSIQRKQLNTQIHICTSSTQLSAIYNYKKYDKTLPYTDNHKKTRRQSYDNHKFIFFLCCVFLNFIFCLFLSIVSTDRKIKEYGINIAYLLFCYVNLIGIIEN